MSNLRQAAQQALEALEEMWQSDKAQSAITALKQALAEPEQEPAPGYCKHCKQYTIEEPLPAEPQTTHWEGCEAVHPECRKPEQESVGHADLGINNIYIFSESEPRVVPAGRTPLYTAPTPRKLITD